MDNQNEELGVLIRIFEKIRQGMDGEDSQIEDHDKKLREIYFDAYYRQNKTKSTDNPFSMKTKAVSPFVAISQKFSSDYYDKTPETAKLNYEVVSFFLTFSLFSWSEALLSEILKATQNGLVSPYYHERDREVIYRLLTRFLDNIKMRSMEKLLAKFGIEVKIKPWMKEVFTVIFLEEVKKFRKEYQKKFSKKNRESLSVTVKKAEEGSDNALFRLIAWDKTWLYEQWVKDRIISAQSTDDKMFFKDLGKNISKLSGVHERTKHPALFYQLKEFKDAGVDFDPKFISDLIDHFNDDEDFPDQLCDDNYFPKFLKRHDLT